jgi:polygalacturonase
MKYLMCTYNIKWKSLRCFVIFFIVCNASQAQAQFNEKNLKLKLNKVADSLTTNLKPWKVPSSIFKVEDFGALSDGQTINTIAIQNAIDKCAASGGGTVMFSKGDYVTGTIQLRSNTMLEIAEGARILGSTNLKDYPEKVESFKSVMSEVHRYRLSLIYAERLTNIGIRGKGEIYFRGEKNNFPGPETIGSIEGRPFGIRMIECKNITVQDINLKNSAAWMQNYLYCENLIIDRITVFNHANFNNDGIDIDGCKNVIVRNCFINSEDDAMCLKGASMKTTQNMLIENSTFISTCNALKIGTDTQGDFKNIIARNLVLGGIPTTLESMKGHEASTGITLATVDGGNVENIFISNVIINQSRCPIFLRVGNRGRVMHGMQKPVPGHIKNIIIKNTKGSNNLRQGSFISGIKGYPIENVIIRNLNIKMQGGGTVEMADALVNNDENSYPDAHQFSRDGLPSYGFYFRYANNIMLKKIKITPKAEDKRPMFKSGGNVQGVITEKSEIQ